MDRQKTIFGINTKRIRDNSNESIKGRQKTTLIGNKSITLKRKKGTKNQLQANGVRTYFPPLLLSAYLHVLAQKKYKIFI